MGAIYRLQCTGIIEETDRMPNSGTISRFKLLPYKEELRKRLFRDPLTKVRKWLIRKYKNPVPPRTLQYWKQRIKEGATGYIEDINDPRNMNSKSFLYYTKLKRMVEDLEREIKAENNFAKKMRLRKFLRETIERIYKLVRELEKAAPAAGKTGKDKGTDDALEGIEEEELDSLLEEEFGGNDEGDSTEGEDKGPEIANDGAEEDEFDAIDRENREMDEEEAELERIEETYEDESGQERDIDAQFVKKPRGEASGGAESKAEPKREAFPAVDEPELTDEDIEQAKAAMRENEIGPDDEVILLTEPDGSTDIVPMKAVCKCLKGPKGPGDIIRNPLCPIHGGNGKK